MKWMSFIHLKVITKLLTKKRINNCNQQQSQTFKGANDYDKQNYFNKEKEKQINT